MEKELKLINVNKIYKLSNKETFQALYDINVEFEKGELVSIVGESGSGKSTLMNLIGGLDSDFTGTILSGGENLGKLTDKELDKYRKNKVGFVFQSFNLISHLSILDNVTLALTLSNVSEKEKVSRATEILKRVGLESQLKKKPTQLSGGQKQRVAIARALINDPDIIIADEPTGALDSSTSMQILDILKEIADSGKLVIMVTHSEKVASISSRVVELSDGRIVGDKTNENYKKNENFVSQEETLADSTQIIKTTSVGKKKNYKDKQNLSMWSAIKLSFHNMWAHRVKNFLMAFGVAIGIGSLILMMSFSSGITDYINDTMNSFSNPTIATISKKGNGKNITSMFDYNYFTDGEDEQLVEDINAYLAENGYNFEINDSNLSYGIQMMTMATSAYVINNDGSFDLFDNNYLDPETGKISQELLNSDLKYESIIYLYTIPPYYTDQNVIEGTLPTKDGGIMFSKSIRNIFDDKSFKNEDGTNRTVDVAFNYDGTNFENEFRNMEITGIMDASIMSGFMVMYIDYDYFQKCFSANNNQTSLAPNILYVQTPSAEITDAINEYLATTDTYTGSIEEQLGNMFTKMSSIIGTSLVVISCISLLVSAMMILVVLYMSVTERTKEIGVLKSIGARRKDIKRIFTSESLLVGILSGIVGIIFNLLLTLIVWLVLTYTIGMAPISYRWWYFFIAMAVSIVISMLSGLYPASKAAKLDPVESLRRE